MTPTPIVSPWFKHNDDQLHCLNLINNLQEFPIKASEEWLNQNYRQFKKFVEDQELTRVMVLTNMWLADGKQHSFPAKTPEDNYLPSAKARLEKDFEYESLNVKNKVLQKKDIFSDLNCKITELLTSPERKSVVTSLKKVSASLMTCQKLYASHFSRYEKQEVAMFNHIMELKQTEESSCEKNVALETQVAGLNCDVAKLRFQLRQKNTHEASLRRMYGAEKKELKALQDVRVLKLEKEVIQLKKDISEGKNTTKLDNTKLKENLKSIKILHKDQLRLKDARITDLNSTIKSLRVKLKTVEKTEANLQAKLFNFQQHSIATLAKREHKKELIEIREKNKKESEEKKMREKMDNKESQKRKLDDAIRMHQGFIPDSYKSVQGKIINNFRKQNCNNLTTHLWNNSYAGRADMSAASMFPDSQDISEVNGGDTIDLTENLHQQANVLEAIPNFMALLNSFSNSSKHVRKSTTTSSTTTDPTTNGRTSRANKKSKLMKVCVDRTRSALKENMGEHMARKKNHVTPTNIDTDSSNSRTSDNENCSLSGDAPNMKMQAVDVPDDTDDSGSVSLL